MKNNRGNTILIVSKRLYTASHLMELYPYIMPWITAFYSIFTLSIIIIMGNSSHLWIIPGLSNFITYPPPTPKFFLNLFFRLKINFQNLGINHAAHSNC